MRFTKLLSVALILLLIVNILLGVNLWSAYKKSNYIDSRTINDTVSLLNESGINIDTSVIPGKKVSYPIYRLDFFDDDESYYRHIAPIIFGKEENTELYMTENGIKIQSSESKKSVEFSSDNILHFVYCASDDMISCENTLNTLVQSGQNISDERAARLIEALNTRFGFSGDQYMSLGIDKTKGSMENEDGLAYIAFDEKLNGFTLFQTKSRALFDENDRLLYLDATIVTGKAEAELSADLYDVINILFDERSLRQGGNISIKGIDTCYYHKILQSTSSKLYLIPAYILYIDRPNENGTISSDDSVRSMLDGKKIG